MDLTKPSFIRPSYTALLIKGVPFSDSRAALLSVAAELATNKVLIPEIREKNGAYGAGATYSEKDRIFTLYSYRDPNPDLSKKVFKNAIESISQGNFSDDDLDEAKIGVLQKLDKPKTTMQLIASYYSDKEAKRTVEMREVFRKRLLSATKEEVIQSAVDILNSRYNKQNFVQVLR